MRIGYLHLGPGWSGVRRYSGHVAAEAARRAGLETVEADGGEPRPSLDGLRRAAKAFASCDVVHVQWKSNDWGRGLRAIVGLVLFTVLCRRPLVVTVHDLYEPRAGWREHLAAERLGVRWLGRRARRLAVHSRVEVGRLTGPRTRRRARVVRHFVEQRHPVVTRAEARAALGLEGRRIVTLLGFITGRKGAMLLVEAIAQLPPDIVALMAGGPIEGRHQRIDEIEARAAALGVADRCIVTGYLDEPSFERVLVATDLAVCPFRDVSASGSLSNWISVARPILASDLPALREYDEVVPGAIRFFSPREPEPFAAAIRRSLEEPMPDEDPAVARLREALATPRALDAYLDVYREAAGAPRPDVAGG